MSAGSRFRCLVFWIQSFQVIENFGLSNGMFRRTEGVGGFMEPSNATAQQLPSYVPNPSTDVLVDFRFCRNLTFFIALVPVRYYVLIHHPYDSRCNCGVLFVERAAFISSLIDSSKFSSQTYLIHCILSKPSLGSN